MDSLYPALDSSGLTYREYGITAIDSYLGSAPGPVRYILVEGSLVDLAKRFENLRYPSLPGVDAALRLESGIELRFSCVDSLFAPGGEFSAYGTFTRDTKRGVFFDGSGVYESLRARRFVPEYARGDQSFFEHAVFLARFGLPPEADTGDRDSHASLIPTLPCPPDVPAEWQKDLLSMLLWEPYSGAAMEFLNGSGFIRKHWPELSALLEVDHAKDCHPEGGGWSHTMEALGHRKNASLTLSLAILLHDVGKPLSEAREGRKFDRHAEIGASVAASFLRRLGFGDTVIRDVHFFIRWHMLPAALPRIPASSVSEIVLDPRFAELLELYRCDEFSTFKGPDAYYAACAAYRSIMKLSRNPYRDVEGRKRNQAFSNTVMRP